jgi:hypothetical protein
VTVPGGEALVDALRDWDDDWGHEKSILDGNISEGGLDALAFYKSIRFIKQPPFRGRWGIFVFDFLIKYLSDELEDFSPARWSPSERATIAFNTLRDHELFHFRVDVWALGAEGITVARECAQRCGVGIARGQIPNRQSPGHTRIRCQSTSHGCREQSSATIFALLILLKE